MININNKSWDELCFSDIQKLLSGTDEENFFFEFKADDLSTEKLAKTISAFSNTYGGYLLLGVNDDKSISGCKKWTEQRIHSTIYDTITPVPNFDVKKFKHDDMVVLVIKIEEGAMPPYITNKGQIFERVSSGSMPIKDSAKLEHLYNKKVDLLHKIKNKIEINPVIFDNNSPKNICGYLDIGFSIVCSEKAKMEKNFCNADFKQISNYIQAKQSKFSISRIGCSYVISIGRFAAINSTGIEFPVTAGMNNFIEIMNDGSVKFRIMLTFRSKEMKSDISHITHLQNVFKKVYSMIFGDKFSDVFIYAHKYEQLTVLKQFVPYYDINFSNEQDKIDLRNYLTSHQTKYGNNLVIEGSRLPKNDYLLIDRRWFDSHNTKYNTEMLIWTLFTSDFFNLGYIDPLIPELT